MTWLTQNSFFVKLINRYFPKYKLNKVCNKINIKISYSCMSNNKNIISGHNNKILAENQPVQKTTCNCKNEENCSLNGNCNISAIVHKRTAKQTKHTMVVVNRILGPGVTTTHTHSATQEKQTQLSFQNFFGNQSRMDTNHTLNGVYTQNQPFTGAIAADAICAFQKKLLF